jgi:hypothetical protein
LIARWVAAGGDRQSQLWREARDFAAHMLSSWPTEGWHERYEGSPSIVAGMLASLMKLNDSKQLEAFLSKVVAKGLFGTDDIEAILAAIGNLQLNRAAAAIESIVAGAAMTRLGPCANLLARAGAAPSDSRPIDLHGAAKALIEALPGDPKRPAPPRDPWERHPAVPSDAVVDIVAGIGRIDPALAELAAEYVLAWQKTYPFDTVLLPAVRKLVTVAGGSPAVERLRMACVNHLRVRTGEALEAPRDWRRASTVSCKCRLCLELSAFLDDPLRESWTLKAPQAERSHVETAIRNAHFDLDCRTERRGSPHSLISTKNQASYEKRVRQRDRDSKDLKQLEV